MAQTEQKPEEPQIKSLDDLVPGLKAAQFGWTEDIRRCLLHILLTDSEFFMAHKDSMEPEFFPDPIHSVMFLVAKNYHGKYQRIPSETIAYNELKSVWNAQVRDWSVAEAEFYAVYDYHEEIADKDYLQDKLVAFCKREAMKKALVDSYEKLVDDDEEFDSEQEIEQILRKALSVGVTDADTIDYFDHFEDRYHEKLTRSQQNITDKFQIGFPSIDNELEGGLGRKEIATFLGDSGTGKSFILPHVAARNVLAGWNVLYITLENSQEVVQDRFDALFTKIRMRNLLDECHAKTLVRLRSMRETCANRLKIMEFEEGSMYVHQIRAITEKLWIRENWSPDVVILDYLDELASHPGMKDYDSQGLNIRDFRAWMKHLNAAGFTATQANRGASDADVVTRKEIGDSYKKIRRSDCMWSISITPEEEMRNICRLYVIKHRNAKQNYVVYLERDLGVAHLKEITQQEHQAKLESALPGRPDVAKGDVKKR